MAISKDKIEEIRNKASITEVIGHYIPLVKKGRGYTALCPFHDDHDPSLSISEEKQIFKCFVCGAGGNVFNFVMRQKGVGFEESVAEVGKMVGIEVNTYQAPKKVDPNQHLYDMLDDMISYSNYSLSTTRGEAALKYLTDRGLDKETIDFFRIGFNPAKNAVHDYLKNKGYQDQDMINTYIARVTNNGVSDVFYNRILFPIIDADNNPIGFSARTMDPNSDAKYINTGETILYHKSDTVYNLNHAKEAIRRNKFVYLNEGVMDVIAMHRAGFDNAICSLGTSLTKGQLKLLSKYTKNISIFYDGDEAGQNATMKAAMLALDEGFTVKVVKNDSGLDPDEIIKKGGTHSLKDVISNEISLVDFAMSYYDDGIANNSEKTRIYVKRMSELISRVATADDIDIYKDLLKAKTKLSTIHLSSISSPKMGYNNVKTTIDLKDYDGLLKAEYYILSQMMLTRDALAIYKRDLGYLLDTNRSELADAIIDDYRNNSKFDVSRFCTDFPKFAELVTDIANREEYSGKLDLLKLDDAIRNVKVRTLEKKEEQIKSRIKEVVNIDFEKEMELRRELTNTKKELETLKRRSL